MACDVFDSFRYAVEYLPQTAYEMASYDDPWMNLIQRKPMPMNAGTHFSTFAIANQEWADSNMDGAQWNPIDLSNQESTTGDSYDDPDEVCTNDWDDMYWGLIEKTYHPEMTQTRGPILCAKELLFGHAVDTFMAGYMRQMAKMTKRVWSHCYAYHHRRLSAKVICQSDLSSAIYQQAAFTALPAATSELTQDTLDYLASWLIEEGATEPDGSGGWISLGDGGPLFTLLIEGYQSNRLCKQNDGLRNDIRYADPTMLMARLGATKTLGNFKHLIDQRPQRYTHNGTDYVAVEKYVEADTVAGAPTTATKGNHYVINPNWRTAPYEGYDVLCPSLFWSQVPDNKTSAPGVSFDGITYNGEWKWVQGAWHWVAPSSCADELSQQGRHYAQFIQAAELNPIAQYTFGLHIIGKRCLHNKTTTTTCSS